MVPSPDPLAVLRMRWATCLKPAPCTAARLNASHEPPSWRMPWTRQLRSARRRSLSRSSTASRVATQRRNVTPHGHAISSRWPIGVGSPTVGVMCPCSRWRLRKVSRSERHSWVVSLFDDLIRPQQQRRRDERQDADEWECSHCYIPAFLSDAWKKEGGGLVPARRERRVQRPPRGLLHGAPGRWPSGRNLTDPRP